MIDHAIELRRQFIASQKPNYAPDPVTRERGSLESRRYAAIQYLRRRGMWILEGNFKPNWGEPDPRYVAYAEGV